MKGPEPPKTTVWHTDAGNGLIGERIVITCRKVNGPNLYQFSGQHKGSAIVASRDARAWLEVPRKAVLDKA